MLKELDKINSKTGDNPSIEQSIENGFFKPRVLVVDDEDRIRSACHRFLSGEGCDVDLAVNGEECLSMIDQSHYDIILLDLMMPGMSGMDVLSRIKSSRPDTVIIVITGYATLEHSIEAMKKGAFDFLSKPFSPSDLRITISKAIEFIRTLQDIAKEKSRMRVMVNSLCNGVLTTDNQKNVVLANPAFLRLMQCRKNRTIGQPVSELIKDQRILDMIDQVMDLSEEVHTHVTDEITIQSPDDNEETVLGVRCIPFRDRLNRSLGTVTLLQDITALKKINQIKTDFVSMVAHELKSPLNSIMMQLNVVLEGLAGELTDKQRQILTRNHDKIRSLTDMTSELLDLAKMESGLINQEKQELDLIEIMQDQVEFYREKAGLKSIEIQATSPERKALVMGNKHNIEEVFSNLISNAIRYTPNSGQINITVESGYDGITLKVSDTGFGISEEEMGNIFNKFYRIKNEKTRYINGTGLGLAIVKSIVEAHHGSINVESKVDEGTTFSVHLPKII